MRSIETRTASIAIEKKWCEKRGRNNDVNVYERIRCELSRSALKGAGTAHLSKNEQNITWKKRRQIVRPTNLDLYSWLK